MSKQDLKSKIQELNFPKVKVSSILGKIPNRFFLTVAVSKRARQIAEGAKPLVEFYPNEPFDPVGLALKEIKNGLIDISIVDIHDSELESLEEMDKTLEKDIEAEKVEEEEPKKGKEKESKKAKKSLATS